MNYKPKPLSQEWMKELKELKDLGHSPESCCRISDLISVLHTCDIMIDRFGACKIKQSKTQALDLASFFYFAHCYHLGFSIYHLAKLNFGNSSLVLARSILESVIDLAYLWLCKEINGNDTDEREAWLEFIYSSRGSIAKKWDDFIKHRNKSGLPDISSEFTMDDITVKQLLSRSEDFRGKYHRKHWSKVQTLDQRARVVDDKQILSKAIGIVLEEVYITNYKWTSELVHGGSGGAPGYMSEVPGELYIDFGANGKNIDIVIPMTTRFLMVMLYIVNHVNHWNIDLIAQYKESGISLGTEKTSSNTA